MIDLVSPFPDPNVADVFLLVSNVRDVITLAVAVTVIFFTNSSLGIFHSWKTPPEPPYYGVVKSLLLSLKTSCKESISVPLRILKDESL